MTQELSAKDKKIKARIEKSLKTFDLAAFGSGRRIYQFLPSNPRCGNCMAPFEGAGGTFLRKVFNIRGSSMNPLVCSKCENFARRLRYGTELEMSMLFADIRGSTSLAESMTPTEFKNLIDRFYNETTHVLVYSQAVLDKLDGDEVKGYYIPGFAGKHFGRRFVEAAQDLLRVTGHADPEGPWVPVGVGIHTGTAYYGAVSSVDGLVELTALGDAVNIAARLGSKAAAGEILISERTASVAGIDTSNLEKRTLELKGKSEQFSRFTSRCNTSPFYPPL
jgi:adenylate cyclase